jgi:small subunit ribosomal protein S4e
VIDVGNKGGSKHLNRIAAAPFGAASRKSEVWLAKPAPGRHKLVESMSLTVLVRDFLKLARDSREAERIIKGGEVLLDGKAEKSPKAGVGLMDIVSIPKAGKTYRILTDYKGRMKLQELDKGKAGRKLCKIVGKRTISKGKIQLSLHDGRTLLADNSYKVGDSLVLGVPSGKVEGNLRLEPGVRCLITKGKHSGVVGKLKEVTKGTDLLEANAKLDADGTEIVTVKKYLFAVGDEF